MIWLLALPALLPMWSDWRRQRIEFWHLAIWAGWLAWCTVPPAWWHPGWMSLLLGLLLGFGLSWMAGLPGGDRYVFAILGAIVGPFVIVLGLTLMSLAMIILLPFWSARVLILETPVLPWWVPITLGLAMVWPAA